MRPQELIRRVLLIAIALVASARAVTNSSEPHTGVVMNKEMAEQIEREVKGCRDLKCFRSSMYSHSTRAAENLRAGYEKLDTLILKSVIGACRTKLQPGRTLCLIQVLADLTKSALIAKKSCVKPKAVGEIALDTSASGTAAKHSSVLSDKLANTNFAKLVRGLCADQVKEGPAAFETCFENATDKIINQSVAASDHFADAHIDLKAFSVISLLCEGGREAVYTPEKGKTLSKAKFGNYGRTACATNAYAKSFTTDLDITKIEPKPTEKVIVDGSKDFCTLVKVDGISELVEDDPIAEGDALEDPSLGGKRISSKLANDYYESKDGSPPAPVTEPTSTPETGQEIR